MATAPPTASVTWCDPIRRHVVPYPHAFETNVKGRWVDKTAVDVFATEFAYYPKDFYTAQARRGALQVRRRGQWLTPEEVLVTPLKTGDTVKHTVHRHELPIVNSGPIELLRFVPAASLGVFAARAADGLLCLSKPPTVPVHPCGRYHRHSVTRLLAEGHVARYRLPTAPPPGFEDFAAPEDLISPYLGGDDEITDMLLQEIVRQVRLGDGAHTVHRLDKATTGLLLVATSKQVSAAVFDALSEKSEEVFEHSAASLRNKTSAPRDADAALGSKRQRPDSDVGGAPTPSAAERTGKIYLARVSGRFPGGGAPIMVQRGIYCASHKAGRFAALSEAEERSRRELAKRRADAAREAGMAPGTSEQEVNVALARKAVLDGGGDDAVAAKREAQRQATQSKSNGDDSEDPADAKWAETTFRLLRYDEATDESVVECRPVTGRTHQLRVHLGLVLGHPIVLDKTYGWHARGEEESTEAAVKRLFALPYMRAQSNTPEVRDVMEGCPECECAADREQLRDATAEAKDDDGSSSNDFWEGFICLHASEYRLVLRGVKNALILSAPPPPWL